jgi:DNA repair exonuclease SbcCD ATPase subunit
MENELEKISERNSDIQAALLPVIKLRDDQEKCEKRIQAAKHAHAKEEKNADAMDALATDVERIRKALLEAKNEIASDLIDKAGPRAQELYAALVKHPLFDRIEIKTSPKANKVDYSFEVSASKVKNSAREARLVLSDGQLTAAAQALLYALAESSAHGLDLLYLDAPTQNLDHSHKEAMARVIAELAENTQVIVSTQDEDFVTLLDDADFKRSAVVHELKDWDRKPEVKTTLPRGGN